MSKQVKAKDAVPGPKYPPVPEGWRLLDGNEVVADGDKCWSVISNEWRAVNAGIGRRQSEFCYQHIRRISGEASHFKNAPDPPAGYRAASPEDCKRDDVIMLDANGQWGLRTVSPAGASFSYDIEAYAVPVYPAIPAGYRLVDKFNDKPGVPGVMYWDEGCKSQEWRQHGVQYDSLGWCESTYYIVPIDPGSCSSHGSVEAVTENVVSAFDEFADLIRNAEPPDGCSTMVPLTDIKLFAAAINGSRGDDQKAIAEEVLKVGTTLLRKNADYGSSVWRPPVLAPDCSPGVAIRVRMSDKISRLQTLMQSSGEVADESIDDTLRDLVGYGILELARPGRNS